MKFNLDDLKKLESSSVTPRVAKGQDSVVAIVKVNEPNYVPKELKVRARIDPTMFTCVISPQQLIRLEKDPQVVSISVSKKLHAIE